MTTHLDTHVAVWLRMGDAKRLRPVRKVLERGPLKMSPFAVLELQMLSEIGRLRESARFIVERLAEDHGVELAIDELASASDRAMDLAFTRDPFDRLIAAHALAARANLLTCDETLLRHVSCARWG